MRFRKLKWLCAVALTLALTLTPTAAADRLIPGGMPFGVKLCCEGVLVVGVGEVETGSGMKSPAKDAGIRVRDVIVGINGSSVASADDVVSAVAESAGEALSFDLKRGEEVLTVEVLPVESSEKKLRTGIWVRDSSAGIGTVTFIDPATGAFAGLGHGICDSDTGELMPLRRGVVVDVTISGVIKGQVGAPGELRGYFSSGKTGSLIGNTECGVFGVFSRLPAEAEGSGMPVASDSEIEEGEAELFCTLDSEGRKRYKVKLSDIDRSGRDVKNFVVTVTDPKLLEKTGGIVQGMCTRYNRDNTEKKPDRIRKFWCLKNCSLTSEVGDNKFFVIFCQL